MAEETFKGSNDKSKEPSSAFGAEPADVKKEIKPEIISTQLQKAVATAKGMPVDTLTVAEYDMKLKRFEDDVKNAYPDLSDLQTIRADFDGLTAREEHAKGITRTTTVPYVGMDPRLAPRTDRNLRPVTMEERLRLTPAQSEAAINQDGLKYSEFRSGSEESIERAKEAKKLDQGQLSKVQAEEKKAVAEAEKERKSA